MPAGHLLTTLIRSDRIDAQKKSQKKMMLLEISYKRNSRKILMSSLKMAIFVKDTSLRNQS